MAATRKKEKIRMPKGWHKDKESGKFVKDEVLEQMDSAPGPKTEGEIQSPVKPYVPTKDRISFALTPDGRLDPGARKDTVERLKAFFKDEENRKALGISEEAASLITEEDVSQIYDALSAIEVMLAPMMRIDKDIAAHVLPWTPQEKQMLVPPTQRVLAKHAPAWFFLWKDEVALLIMLASMVRMKVTEAMNMQRARWDHQNAENRAKAKAAREEVREALDQTQ
jgi:hypothetical protein